MNSIFDCKDSQYRYKNIPDCCYTNNHWDRHLRPVETWEHILVIILVVQESSYIYIYIYISSKRDADPSKYTESSITWRGALWSPISAFRKGGITPIINPTIYESKAVRGVNPRIASILKHKVACLVYTLSDILTWPRNRRGKKSGLKLHAAC
jgi:hypothetical protein